MSVIKIETDQDIQEITIRFAGGSDGSIKVSSDSQANTGYSTSASFVGSAEGRSEGGTVGELDDMEMSVASQLGELDEFSEADSNLSMEVEKKEIKTPELDIGSVEGREAKISTSMASVDL